MKKVLIIVGSIVGLIAIVIIGFVWNISANDLPSYEKDTLVFEVSPTPELVAKGARLSSMLCNHCHMAKNERLLTGRKVEDIDPAFGEIYSANITKDPIAGIGKWTPEDLAYLIRTGIKKDGRYAPPYMPKFPLMSDEDLKAIIAFLQSDHSLVTASSEEPPVSSPSLMTKMLARMVFKPLPYPEAPVKNPDTTDVIAWGSYLANGVYGCFHCHSADFKTNNELVPDQSAGFYGGGNKLFNLKGEVVLSPNITPHETGIGDWTAREFVNLVKYGQRPNGQPVAYPMLPYAALEDREVEAIYAYLKTVTPIENKVQL